MSSVGHYRRGTCRLCGGHRLTEVLSLRPTPPANAFITERELGKAQDVYPLDVYFCEDCAHVQLLDVVDPALLFGNYVYVSGTSPVFIQHFKSYAEAIASAYAPAPHGELVLDIGSNDGTLLKQFQDLGMTVLGVDPARDIAAAATNAGIETMATFFSRELAGEIRAKHGPAKVVTANNVFAHADDLSDITLGVCELLSLDGVFVFEVSYLVDVFEDTLFDTIYHEHLAYHTVRPLQRFFDRHGLELIKAERVASHGGSLRGVVQHKDGPHAVDGSVSARVEHEAEIGLYEAATLQQLGLKIFRVGTELMALLKSMKASGKRIAGFGAPAKATTLMYQFDMGPDMIDFIVDDSPLKQDLFSPGMHIPVLPSEALYSKRPDAVVVLAWNFAEAIIKKNAAFVEQGGQFIVPLPNVRIVG
ncbi:MAG: SAM-dependent methyltransferase [Magnetovibrio sp.]|nr:SAM-dependent methyltransferase [Magnetovibrio sp.]